MEEDGLFDESHIEDEPFNALPPPLSPGQGLADPFGDDDNGEVSKLADVPEAKKRGVKRPRPKLDSSRLISDRGLPALRTLFSDVHFKGKGHEAEDLRLLMKRMENWAHRLFPKLQFEDFIDKVERLGSKKEVQTCLKRIRLDMPLTHDDYMSKEGEQEEIPPEEQIFGDPDPFGGEHFSSSPRQLVHSTPAPGAATAHLDDLSLDSPSPALPSLTEEQQRRMAENRLKALERRLSRQKQQETQPVPMEDGTDPAPEVNEVVSQVVQENEDEEPVNDEDSSSAPELQKKHSPRQDEESLVESNPDQEQTETCASTVLDSEEQDPEGSEAKVEE